MPVYTRIGSSRLRNKDVLLAVTLGANLPYMHCRGGGKKLAARHLPCGYSRSMANQASGTQPLMTVRGLNETVLGNTTAILNHGNTY